MSDDYLEPLGLLVLGSRLKRAGTLLMAATQNWLADKGCEIPAAHMPLLSALEREGGVPLGKIAKKLGIAQPGVSRMVDSLVADGWISTVSGVEDKRVRIVELTPKGREFVEEAKRFLWPVVYEAVSETCADLSGALLEQLTALEGKLTSGAYQNTLNEVSGKKGWDE